MFVPFTIKSCSQDCGRICGTDLASCPTYRKLSVELQEQCQKHSHLLQYLHAMPMDETGIPQFFEKITRNLKELRQRNLVYPVSEDVFIHILYDAEDARDYYIPIEPCLSDNQEELLDRVETLVADYVDNLENISDPKQRAGIILNIIDQIITIKNHSNQKATSPEKENGEKPSKNSRVPFKRNGKKTNGIVVDTVQYQALCYLLRRKLNGLGVLQPMISDSNIEDISCSGLGNIYVEHKIFGGLKATIGFDNNDGLDKYVIQLAEAIKHPVTFRNPTVDATLPDGSRINIVYGTDVSKRGSNFTIRKFTETPISIIELIQFGTMDFNMAAYLSLVIQDGMNVWISGETASGKTTLMNALTTFVSPEAKIVSIEDTPEVQVPHHNWIRGVTRSLSKNSEASEVSMFDLLKAALRQRPNLIIVGEIRGVEGSIAFQAMQSGHSCMSTFHAASVTKLIQRLSGDPINVPKSYIDNLNVVVICQSVRLPNGSHGRRITSINEIVGYDSVSDAFSFIATFQWKPLTDEYEFRGYQNSYILEEKIAPRRGIPYEKRQQIYSQIKQRAEVLKRLRDQKITNFHEVYSILSKAYREGYFR